MRRIAGDGYCETVAPDCPQGKLRPILRTRPEPVLKVSSDPSSDGVGAGLERKCQENIFPGQDEGIERGFGDG